MPAVNADRPQSCFNNVAGEFIIRLYFIKQGDSY